MTTVRHVKVDDQPAGYACKMRVYPGCNVKVSDHNFGGGSATACLHDPKKLFWPYYWSISSLQLATQRHTAQQLVAQQLTAQQLQFAA